MSTRPPLGVVILSVIATVAGIIYLIAGLQLAGIQLFGTPGVGSGFLLSGIFTIVVGAIWLAVGGALWSLQPWALIFAEIIAIFALLSAFFTFIATGSGGGSAYGLGGVIVPILVLWYVRRPDITAAFATSAPPPAKK